jgi:hypothetical protein
MADNSQNQLQQTEQQLIFEEAASFAYDMDWIHLSTDFLSCGRRQTCDHSEDFISQDVAILSRHAHHRGKSDGMLQGNFRVLMNCLRKWVWI